MIPQPKRVERRYPWWITLVIALVLMALIPGVRDSVVQLWWLRKTAGPVHEALRQKDISKAVRLAGEAVDQGAPPAAVLGLMQVFVAESAPLEAAELGEKALKRSDQAKDALWINRIRMSVGDALMVADRPHDALRHYRAVTPDPLTEPVLWNNLAYAILLSHGDPDEAETLARKALAAVQQRRAYGLSEAAVQDTLGWALLHRGQYPEAHSLLLDAMHQSPGDPDVVWHAAVASWAVNDQPTAAMLMRRAEELYRTKHRKPPVEFSVVQDRLRRNQPFDMSVLRGPDSQSGGQNKHVDTP